MGRSVMGWVGHGQVGQGQVTCAGWLAARVLGGGWVAGGLGGEEERRGAEQRRATTGLSGEGRCAHGAARLSRAYT